MQRDLLKPLKVADPRFAGLRQRYELHVRSPHNLGFAQECSLGSVEPLEFFLLDKQKRHRRGQHLRLGDGRLQLSLATSRRRPGRLSGRTPSRAARAWANFCSSLY